MRGPDRLRMGEVCHASVCAAAPISQVISPIAKAVAEPLPRIGKAQLGYRCPNRFGGHRERIHACGQGKRALCEELGELAWQPRQLPRDELRQLGDSPIARALKSRAKSTEMLRSSTPAIDRSQLAEQLPLHERVSDGCGHPNLVGVVDFPGPRPAEPGLQIGEPGPEFLVEYLEKDRFAAVEVAQYVGLGQPDAVGQFPQADVGHVLLGQHFACAGQDRRAASRHLFGPAGALKTHS